MLNTDTKRRIDSARDVLVGKVPDPKAQVEQITIALIYKFMNDMGAEAEGLGGKRKFFADEFARFSWPKLLHDVDARLTRKTGKDQVQISGTLSAHCG
jgi:type I restriction enzyme M protein